jgi:murein DD-endopeptidase MepM/ murein hydrolase activator NlpD
VTVSRDGARGSVSRARFAIVAASFGSENIDLGDIPQGHPSAADLQRNARDQARLARLWRRPEGPPRFTLPLAAPLTPLPKGTGFGAEWHFNTTPPSSETHAGLDYAAKAGSRVSAMADGTVVLADDLFFSGNTVVIDHGDGLFTTYLHLADMEVRAGQEVGRGDLLGHVGDTGRTTGPHLHLAVRWHRARVDPRLLLEDPAKIPAIGAQR